MVGVKARMRLHWFFGSNCDETEMTVPMRTFNTFSRLMEEDDGGLSNGSLRAVRSMTHSLGYEGRKLKKDSTCWVHTGEDLKMQHLNSEARDRVNHGTRRDTLAATLATVPVLSKRN